MSSTAVRGGQVFIEIGADPKKFFAALNGLQKRIGQMGASLTNLGTRMATVGTALALPLGLAMRNFAQFDDAIRATGAVSQASASELQRLTEVARNLGATTSFTAVEVANLMTELGRAGFSPKEIENMTGAVLDLSRATGTDAALSASIMSATLRQFGLGATEATRAADVLTAAANMTNVSVEGLGESLKYAGPVANSLGMSLEDTTAILGVLGNVGIFGSEAGTALRRLGVISAGAGDKLQELFGVSNQDAAGNLKPLITILDEINDVTANMPVAERTKLMAEAFGLLGITSANVLSKSAGGVSDLAAALKTADGVAAKTAKQMDAGLGGSIRIALSAIGETSLAIGDALAPGLQKLVDFIGQVATAVTAFVKENEALVISFTKGVAIFTASGVALLGLGAALSVLSFALGALSAAASLVIVPLVAIASTTVAMTIGFVKATAGVIAYASASVASAVASGIAWTIANAPLLALIGILGALGVAVYSLVGGFAGLADGLRSGLVTAAENTVTVFGDVGDAVRSAMGGIYDSIVAGDLAGAMQIALKGLEVTARRIFSSLKSEIGGFQAFMVNTADAFQTYASQPLAMFESINDPFVKADRDAMQARQAARLSAVPGATQINQEHDSGMTDLNAMVRKSRDTRIIRDQAGDVTASVESAPSFDAMREMADEFHTLSATGLLTKQSLDNYKEAVDKATDRLSDGGGGDAALKQEQDARRKKTVMDQQAGDLTKNIGSVQSLSDLQDLQGEFDALKQFGRLSEEQASSIGNALELAATQFSPDVQQNKADVAGTFSSVALGGMGFGSSLAQKQLEEQKKTNQILEKKLGEITDDGAVAA